MNPQYQATSSESDPQRLLEKRRLRKTLILFILSVTLIAFMTSHATMSIDPPVQLKIAESIVDHGDVRFRINADDPSYYVMGEITGPDGHTYTMYHGIGQSLIFTGPYYFFRHLVGIESDKLLRSAIAATLFPLNLALTGWIFFLLLRAFDFSPRRCLVGAMLLVFGTGLWELSKESQSACHLAFFYVLGAYGLRKYQLTSLVKYLALGAVAIGFTFIIRSDVAPAIICFLIFSGWLITCHNRTTHRKGSFGKKAFPFFLVVAAMLPFLFIEIAFNMKRFGHPVASYSWEVSWELFFVGLRGLLFSPGAGIFLYNPIVILAVGGWFSLWRRHRDWALYILFGFLGCLLLHSPHAYFYGPSSWGPRYLARTLPLLMLAVCFFGLHLPRIPITRRVIFTVVATLSVLVQVASVSLHHTREELAMVMNFNQMTVNTFDLSAPLITMFEPEAHFIKHRLVNLVSSVDEMINDKIAPWPTLPSHLMSAEEQLQAPVLHYLAFWPFHLTYYMPAVKPEWALPLWGSALIWITGLLAGLMLLKKTWRICPNDPQAGPVKKWRESRNSTSAIRSSLYGKALTKEDAR
ncbi:MAG: hypothetical protein IID32_06520 [Planctomycetes bacterium]|nr:hypothetical protein [Planctomycetota bacterium]